MLWGEKKDGVYKGRNHNLETHTHNFPIVYLIWCDDKFKKDSGVHVGKETRVVGGRFQESIKFRPHLSATMYIFYFPNDLLIQCLAPFDTNTLLQIFGLTVEIIQVYFFSR